MLAYGYRVASNVVYGNGMCRKVPTRRGFFLFFVTCRNDVCLPLFAGCPWLKCLKPNGFNGFRKKMDPIFN
ncbi:hypothetical protein EMIT0P218_240027 [Pseudomonas sp. IT-P218]